MAEEAARLPKVKSTINSHPKFLTKSHLLGFNKYTGSTFRYTPLDAQKIDGTRSQLFDIMHKKGFDNQGVRPQIQASQTQLFDEKHYAATRDLSGQLTPKKQRSSSTKKLAVPAIDELVKISHPSNKWAKPSQWKNTSGHDQKPSKFVNLGAISR